MGKVVKLDAGGGQRPAAGRDPAFRRRQQRSRSALVLGGGGFTGGVYEIGALRALDLLSVNRTVNQFDVFVGTSAGSFVAAAVASGVSPEEMMRVVVDQAPLAYPTFSAGAMLKPNYLEYLARAAPTPWRIARLLRGLVRNPANVSMVDVVLGLADFLPSGLYTTSGIERYVRTLLTAEGRTNDFRLLGPELFLAATDLDTCERIVFGTAGWDDVPISEAVAASCALPMIYRPVEIKDRELVDGGILSTTNVDIAVEAGARFIVVVNPLVPYVNDFDKRIRTFAGSRLRRVSDMGFPQIGYQTFKLLAYQRLHEMANTWAERYPGVDIILIEPEPNDELMFQTGIMSYASHVDVARHGFQSVTLKLAKDYEHFKRICARHGIEISATRVRKVVRHFEGEREKAGAWRKILEQTTSALLRQSAQD